MTANNRTGDTQPLAFEDLSPDQARDIDQLCDYFEHQLYTDGQPKIEPLLGGFHEPTRGILLRELLWLELEAHRVQDARPSEELYCRRFAEHERLVREVFAAIFPNETASFLPALPVPATDDDWPTIPDYRILRKLSSGGMGSVYEAIHTRLGSRVAVKVLREKLLGSVEAEVLFEREMKVIGALNHPNIVAARDARTFAGRHYLIMEYVEGLDLGEVLKRLRTLTVGDACEVARSAAWALQHAHEHRLVHRDIKPKNILLGRASDGTACVKVADFGLASLVAFVAVRDQQNSPGRVAGTYAFMAPEQYWERSADIRSDIYGLGCTLYCLLVGQSPFPNSRYPQPVELMEAHRSLPVPNLRHLRPDVSPRLEEILLSMLAKSPDDRFQSPRKVAEALVPFAEDHDLTVLLERASEYDSAENFTTERRVSPGQSDAGQPQRETSHNSFRDQNDTLSWEEAPRRPAEPLGPCPPSLPPIGSTGPSRDLPEETSFPEADCQRRRYHKPNKQVVAVAVALVILVFTVWLGFHGFRRPPELDLLPRIDPATDAIHGLWHKEEDSVLSPETAQALLQIPSPLPEQYRLEIQAERLSGGRLVIGLIWRGRRIPVILDAMRIMPHGPGTDPAAAGSATEIPPEFDYHGPPESYVCVVRREGIVVALENQVEFTWWPEETLDASRAQWMIDNWKEPTLMLGTHVSRYRFWKIQLTPLID
jgi:serine/threonine protein kinase